MKQITILTQKTNFFTKPQLGFATDGHLKKKQGIYEMCSLWSGYVRSSRDSKVFLQFQFSITDENLHRRTKKQKLCVTNIISHITLIDAISQAAGFCKIP